MSSEREDAPVAVSPPPPPQRRRARTPMRGEWSGWRPWTEEEQAEIDIRECTDARCMSVDVNVGYQGLVEGSVLSTSAAVGNELRAAWQTKLEDEGKANAGGTSLRETIFGSLSDPK